MESPGGRRGREKEKNGKENGLLGRRKKRNIVRGNRKDEKVKKREGNTRKMEVEERLAGRRKGGMKEKVEERAVKGKEVK